MTAQINAALAAFGEHLTSDLMNGPTTEGWSTAVVAACYPDKDPGGVQDLSVVLWLKHSDEARLITDAFDCDAGGLLVALARAVEAEHPDSTSLLVRFERTIFDPQVKVNLRPFVDGPDRDSLTNEDLGIFLLTNPMPGEEKAA